MSSKKIITENRVGVGDVGGVGAISGLPTGEDALALLYDSLRSYYIINVKWCQALFWVILGVEIRKLLVVRG